MASGMVLGIVLLLLVAIVALFFVFGGPARFTGGTTTAPSQTNVNVPAQQPQSGPNINVPRQIDVKVNQQPAQQQPAPQQPAQQSAPQQPAQQQPAAPNR